MGEFIASVVLIIIGFFAGVAWNNAHQEGLLDECARYHKVYECKLQFVPVEDG